ncbi:Zinc finger, GRF-type [Sesbania bispinosa]|nr:Zinc finger, GRF-type [Sesbania bispinosa]
MRSGVCKSSSASSISRRQICACGDEVALMKSSTTKNPGRMFLRCPNWDFLQKQITCNYFRWADDEIMDTKGRTDELQCYVQEIKDLKKKLAKLKRKLSGERFKFKATVCLMTISMVITIIVCMWVMMNSEGVRKRILDQN